MKQKIVIKVILECEKCRSKAMETAAAAPGVTSVTIQGKENNELVVVGNDVDVVCLISGLRKKVRYANLVGVSEVKAEEPKPKPSPDEEKPKPKPEPKPKPPELYYPYPYSIPYAYPSLPPVYVCELSYPKFW